MVRTITKLKNWQIQLNKAEAQLAKTENSLEDTNDEIKNLGKSTDDAGGKFEKFGGVLKGVGVAMGAVAVAAELLQSKWAKMLLSLSVSWSKTSADLKAVFGKYAESIQKSGEEAYKNLGITVRLSCYSNKKMGALFQGSGNRAAEKP